jgi:hypothetical protein
MSVQQNRTPDGQFAPDARAQADVTLTRAPRTFGHPDGPLTDATFDIDDQFGPLAGFDDGRRWNGWCEPWLTPESLVRVREVTGAWAQGDDEVERIDDGPDGVWRFHGGANAEPVALERMVTGDGDEEMYRLPGWCWTDQGVDSVS